MIASRRSGMVPFPVERRRALFPPEIPLYHPAEDVIYCII